MHKIAIYSVGKCKERWLEEALKLYEKRLISEFTFETHWAKDDLQLLKWAETVPHGIALDLKGPEFSSELFAEFFYKNLEASGARLAFFIGGPEGLPQKIVSQFPSLRLSRMTLTHQMCRLFLVEQIFRAYSIRKGSPYHK